MSSLYKDDPTIKKQVSIDQLAGKRIAIDGGVWINSIFFSACSRHFDEFDPINKDLDPSLISTYFLERLKDDLLMMLSNQIVPLVVLEGSAPEEKQATVEARRQRTDKNLQRLTTFIKERKEQLYSASDIEEARKILKSCPNVPLPKRGYIESILKDIGIPCLRAKGEAERLCANLCRQGWAWATLSSDTDTLTHGCTVVITKMTGRMCTIVYLHPLLKKLDLTYRQFVDLCIMAGCDYNTNIPKIGIKRSLSLIKRYGSIDQLPDNYEIGCLNHVRCRELFALEDSQALTDDPISDETVNFNPPIDEDHIYDTYEAIKLLDLVPLMAFWVDRLPYIRPPQPPRL